MKSRRTLVIVLMAIVAFSYFCYIDAIYREQEEDKARLHEEVIRIGRLRRFNSNMPTIARRRNNSPEETENGLAFKRERATSTGHGQGPTFVEDAMPAEPKYHRNCKEKRCHFVTVLILPSSQRRSTKRIHGQ